MKEFCLLYFREMIIGILFIALTLSIKKNIGFKKKLIEEYQKRVCPLLDLSIEKNSSLAFLVNNSKCIAKDIKIEDMVIYIDYGFKKELILKFEPISQLKPLEKIQFVYHVFDKGYDITSSNSKSLVHHFITSDIEMHLSYSNIENVLFRSIIGIRNGQFEILKIQAE